MDDVVMIWQQYVSLVGDHNVNKRELKIHMLNLLVPN